MRKRKQHEVILTIMTMLTLVALAATVQARTFTIVLDWNPYIQGVPPTGEPAVGFHVYKQPGCTGPLLKQTTTPLPLPVMSWTEKLVDPPIGSLGCYFINAVDRLGREVPSNEGRFQMPGPPVAPAVRLRISADD